MFKTDKYPSAAPSRPKQVLVWVRLFSGGTNPQ
jgi:hypothetical protein